MPSAEEATDDQELLGELDFVQVAPEFVEMKIGAGSKGQLPVAPAAATSFLPSAEQATDGQLLLGALVCVQVAPESDEV